PASPNRLLGGLVAQVCFWGRPQRASGAGYPGEQQRGPSGRATQSPRVDNGERRSMLHLVRHGRTDANAAGLLLGRAGPPLSDEGRRQAAALATAIPPDARVVSSPLARTRETAAAFGRPVEIDERWIELDYGEFDGVPLRDVPADIWREWRANPT